MRRRWWLALPAVVSLAICLATVVLWVRSYRGFDTVFHYQAAGRGTLGGDDYQLVSCGPGRLEYRLTGIVGSGGTRPKWFRPWGAGTSARRGAECFGFGVEYKVDCLMGFAAPPGGVTATLLRRTVWVPHWLVVLLTGVLPIWWGVSAGRAYRRRRRGEIGRCRRCDYDLTGNTSGVCPECGSRV